MGTVPVHGEEENQLNFLNESEPVKTFVKLCTLQKQGFGTSALVSKSSVHYILYAHLETFVKKLM